MALPVTPRVSRYLFDIWRREKKSQVKPHTKEPFFQLSTEIENWARGMSFEQLMQKSTVDEGELIRYFRMVIQLLRELRSAPHASDGLRDKTSEAITAIKRDVVDAEKQLRVEG